MDKKTDDSAGKCPFTGGPGGHRNRNWWPEQLDIGVLHTNAPAADPMGAALYNYYAHGVLKAEGSSITEGIGQGRITRNLEDAPIDVAYQIPDEELVPIIFDLLEHEGLCLGGSSGINVAGAIRLAKEMGPGHTIVTLLCDYGTRYQSKLFNPEFLKSKNLPAPQWLVTQPPPPPGCAAS